MVGRLWGEWDTAAEAVLEQVPQPPQGSLSPFADVSVKPDAGARSPGVLSLLTWDAATWRALLVEEGGSLRSCIGQDSFFHLVAASLAVVLFVIVVHVVVAVAHASLPPSSESRVAASGSCDATKTN